MKTLVKALVGGVIVQVSIFLLLLIGVLIDVDRLLPNVARTLVVAIQVTAPGVLYLVPEGEPHNYHYLRLATGVLIDTILYSIIMYVFLLLWRVARRTSYESP
jgi:hypothetical protein